MSILSLLLQVISGAAGGNIAASLFQNLNLGTTASSIIGMIGGAAGGRFLEQLCASNYSTTDTQIFLCSVAGGAVGGSLLTIVAGFIHNVTSRRP